MYRTQLDACTPKPDGATPVSRKVETSMTTTSPVNATPPPPPIRAFAFDGGAATYLGTALGGFFVTVLTLGICYPWSVVMRYRWRTKHTIINGHRLRFTGNSAALFAQWIKWWFLIVITLGIYSFWVGPRLTRWIVEHQEFDPATVSPQPSTVSHTDQ